MSSKKLLTILVVGFMLSMLVSSQAMAHCDTLNGPVVQAGQRAVETGNVNLSLIWVKKKDEDEVKNTFQKALSVRKLNAEARELADMYFFETLVRLHRAGEGEAFTGLKPPPKEADPIIAAADRAVETGNIQPLLGFLPKSSHGEVLDRFNKVMALKNYRPDDVIAGREYVENYVEYLHFAEEAAEEAARKEEKAVAFEIPTSLKAEHKEIHEELAKVIKLGGKTGEAAKEVEKALHPHFLKEEEYAMPPLGLLQPLSEGKVTPDVEKVIEMTVRLKKDMPEMLKEHQAVVAALKKLSEAAKAEKKPEAERFADRLTGHARNEEEVLYPAAILVGEYLKLKLKK